MKELFVLKSLFFDPKHALLQRYNYLDSHNIFSQMDYKLTRRSTSQNISLRLRPDGTIHVSAPFYIPKFIIDQFVRSKENWIKSKQTQINTHKQKKSKDTLQIWGQDFKIQTGSKDYIDFTSQIIHTTIKSTTHLNSILRIELMNHLTNSANTYSQKLSVNYKAVRLKKVSSIWGSCSYDNNLTFNEALITLPKEVADYVVVHEVCHIIEKNHSSHFWSLVRSLDPLFREHRHFLKRQPTATLD